MLGQVLVSSDRPGHAIQPPLGLGFGLGETWFLAYQLTSSRPDLANGAFLPLFGFFGERVAVTLAHACLTAFVTVGLWKRTPVRSFLVAVGLHYAINFGAGLHRAGYISFEVTTILVGLAFILLLRVALKIQQQLPRFAALPPREITLIKR